MAMTKSRSRSTAGEFRRFAAALLKLARSQPKALDAYLCCAEDSRQIANTKATLRCHVVREDAHGHVRVDALIERLSQVVLDYAMPRSRIRQAFDLYRTTGSTQAIMALRDEARSLFTSNPLSGEGGELLLFWMTENVLGLPQVLCKMPLKTNTNQHYHGVDGVHAQPGVNGTLSMVWGESKLYAPLKTGLKECFESIAPFLTGPVGGNRARRDIELLRDNVDLDDPKIESYLKQYLDRGNSKSLAMAYKAVCLVGFNHAPYPKAGHTVTDAALKQTMAKVVDVWEAEVQSAVASHKVDAFEMDAFLVAMPAVDEFRNLLRSKLGLAP